MKIGYLMNSYPMTSTTFIRDEIQAHEAQGVEIVRYAIREWPHTLVDEKDKAEQARTHYILTGRMAALATDFLAELVTNPLGIARALGTWQRLVRNAGGGLVRHCAYLLEAVSLKRQADRDNVRHIHTHFATNAPAVALLSNRLGGPSYSFTAHGPEDFENTDRSSLREKIEGARFVAAISNFCRAQLAVTAGMSIWSKLHIVRCGVDTRTFTASDAAFDGNATFVCVGRFSQHKTQALIVEATSRVALTHPQVRVLLIGDGENRGLIEAAIRRFGMQAHVTLMGWRNNAEVRRTLGDARALLLPSFAEGLPVVIMEAFALGRPVVTTYVAGIPELVDARCGWMIPAGAIDDIAQAMIAALEAPSSQLADMGREGRRRVLEAHDVQRNAAVLRELLTQAAAAHK
jgi:glycosyltransferase involved in cell wall biosynthesis